MLQFETLPASLTALLVVFRPCFTAPSFRTFAALVAGMVAQPGRRTITGMIIGAGLARVWHHSRAHWFFAGARWSVEQVSTVLTGLVVSLLVPAHAAVLVAIDDTVFHRSGRTVAQAGWHHDGAASRPGRTVTTWGHCWVIAAVVVTLPFTDRPVALPVAFALWTKGGPTKQVLAGQLAARIAAACPGRQIDVVADCWYAGADGAGGAATGGTSERGFPPGVTLTSRLRVNAVLSAIATPTPGKGGRPKRIGARLGTAKDLATTATWTTRTVTRYGRTDTVHIAQYTCLWYGTYRSRTIRVILVRDPHSTTKSGYDLALITTDLTATAEQIITRYAARWSIEVTNENAKQITGVGQARNRTTHAVHRTVPFGLLVQTLVYLWYTTAGHHPNDTIARRTTAPWYRTKTHPAYHDMITKLRRVLIAARFRAGKPRNPTPEETLDIHLAWAEAAA